MTLGCSGVQNEHRQHRWLKLHDQVYRAACELFVETDFVSTSYDAIASRAGVARKTVFNHFPRKRDFILEWGQRRRLHMKMVPEVTAGHGNFEETVREYFNGLARLSVGDRPLIRAMLMGWRETGGPFGGGRPGHLLSVFDSLLVKAVERNELRHTAQSGRLALVLYSSYFGILYDWIEGSDDCPPFDLYEVFDRMIDGILNGFGVQPGDQWGETDTPVESGSNRSANT